MSSVKHWYAVYTRPKAEKKVTEALHKRKFEAYCPTKQVVQERLGRKKLVQEPLIPSFVFVKTTETEHTVLKSIDGILNLVYWMGQPAVMREVEIHMMRQFLEDHSIVNLEKTEVNAKEIVRIVKNRVSDLLHGIHSNDKDIYKLVLPSLGYALVAETAVDTITVIGEMKKLNTNNLEKVYAIR